MPEPYEPGPQGDDELGLCAVGQALVDLIPPVEVVFRILAKTPSFMRIFRLVKASVIGGNSWLHVQLS